MNCLRMRKIDWKWSTFSLQYAFKSIHTNCCWNFVSVFVTLVSESCWRWLTTISPEADRETQNSLPYKPGLSIILYDLLNVQCTSTKNSTHEIKSNEKNHHGFCTAYYIWSPNNHIYILTNEKWIKMYFYGTFSSIKFELYAGILFQGFKQHDFHSTRSQN